MLFVSLVSYVIGSRETAPMQLSAGQINPTFLLFSVYYMAMKNLPRHIQELIANHLDPKSSARLRAVSREMKDVVDARRPPTGSYQRKTGRFQKRFSIKGFEKCKTKHAKHFTGMEDIRHFSHFMGFGHRHYSDLKKAYKRNTLFRDFKSITTDETEDMYWQDSIAIWPHMASDHAFRLEMKSAWRSSIKERRDFRRMVIRLLKLWARDNESYAETLRLVRRRTAIYTDEEEQKHKDRFVRRRTAIYTDEEEQKHKDRLMDAIIVQSAVHHSADDPTKTIIGKDGAPLSLEKKIARIVKLCATSVSTSTTHVN